MAGTPPPKALHAEQGHSTAEIKARDAEILAVSVSSFVDCYQLPDHMLTNLVCHVSFIAPAVSREGKRQGRPPPCRLPRHRVWIDGPSRHRAFDIRQTVCRAREDAFSSHFVPHLVSDLSLVCSFGVSTPPSKSTADRRVALSSLPE